MEKLSREEVRELVQKIRMGEGNDAEGNLWIQQILDSVPNRDVIGAIMAGPNATVDDIMQRLYTSNVIQL